MLFPVLLTTALVQAPQGDVWIPARPVVVAGLDEATCAASAGPWVAFVQVLPLPESLRAFHAPHPPWKLVRVGPGSVPEVITEAAAIGGGGWGSPSLVAVADDGTVAASWRPGHQVLIAPPGKKAVQHDVHDDASLDCVALSAAWILHRDERSGALTGRRLTAGKVGDKVPLGEDGPKDPRHSVFGAPWLVWIDSSHRLAAVDPERRERRSLALPAAPQLTLDGIWNGRLLMHEEGKVHVVDLERSATWSLPAPASVTGCVPEGVFANVGFWDPVGGGLTRIERSPFWDGRLLLLRRAPGVLWIRERPRQPWHELRTDAGLVARPKEPAAPPLPDLPEQPKGEAGDAARAAWRAARGR